MCACVGPCVCVRLCVCACVWPGALWHAGGQQRKRSRAPPPIHPFLSRSNSHWFLLKAESRAPRGRTVWFVKGREDRTRPSSSPAICSPNTTTPTNHPYLQLSVESLHPLSSSSLLTSSSHSLSLIPPSLTPFLSLHPLIYRPHASVGEAILWVPGPKHSGGMQWVCCGHMACVCLCVCVPRTGWMAVVGTSTSSPSHRTHTQTVAHSMAGFGLVSYRKFTGTLVPSIWARTNVTASKLGSNMTRWESRFQLKPLQTDMFNLYTG